MIEYQDDCVGCTSTGLHCIGLSCPNKHSPHWFCDECGDEVDPRELYEVNDGMFCKICVLGELPTVM